MSVLLLLDVLIAFALVCIGLLVLVRSPKLTSNRLYFLLTLFTACWIVSNYASNSMDISATAALVANHLVLLFPGLMLASFLGFVLCFTSPQHRSHKLTLTAAAAAVTFLLTLTPLVVKGITRQNDVYAIDFGVLAPLYFLAILVTAGLSLYQLWHGLKKLSHEERQNRLIIFWSLSSTIGLNVITNVGLPFLNGSFLLTNIGPLSAIFIVIGSAYAILKHHLFDIRFLILRTVAYLMTLAVLASVYGVIVLGIAKEIFDLQITIWAQIYISLATALASLGFGSLKAFFDRVTNRLFYRDAYDTQALLDSLNRLFVANTDLGQLLRQSSVIIASSFKAEYCYFGIKESDTSSQRIIGAGSRKVSSEDIELVRRLTPHIHQKIIVTDDLSGVYDPLKAVLKSNSIAAMGRLTADVHHSAEGLGYLVIGSRRSGNPYNARDLRVLETIVNELVIAIQNGLRFEQIQHFNATLQANVNDATGKLRRTNEKLKALDATKDDFITMASHQLRTPLTAVKGYLSMVLEGDAGKLNANQRKLLEQSYLSSQRMVYLIADLLNLSRLNTGKFVIQPSSVNLAEVVQAEVDQLNETARSREVTLTYSAPDSFPDLQFDETKIHQVVMNFIDNAIYYTPAGGHIHIELNETPTSVEYRVHDDGIGVPRAEQRHLFTKFYRAGNARKARPDGTGLGLFMAKKVIAAQGGVIIFESQEGKGSTFGFRFNKRGHSLPTIESAQDTEAGVTI